MRQDGRESLSIISAGCFYLSGENRLVARYTAHCRKIAPASHTCMFCPTCVRKKKMIRSTFGIYQLCLRTKWSVSTAF